MPVFNPVVTADFMSPTAQSPISRMYGNSPSAGGSGIAPTPAEMTISEYFTSTPDTQFLNNGSGVVNTIPASNYNTARIVTPITHSATGGPDSTGYIECEVDPASSNGGNMDLNISSDYLEGISGNPNRKYWFRSLRRWSDTVESATDLMGKFQYQVRGSGAVNSKVTTMEFDTANMSGHRTGTTAAAFSFNSANGLWEGGKLATGHGTVQDGTALIITNAGLISDWGTRSVVSVKDYDSATGDATLYPMPNSTGNAYTDHPIGNSIGYILMPNLATPYSYSHAGGTATGDFVSVAANRHSPWRLACINTVDTPVFSTSGTLTFDDGVVITGVTIVQQYPRIAADLLSDTPSSGTWLTPLDVTAKQQDTLAWTGWTFGGGSFWEFIRFNGASPMNLAANSLNFNTKDHFDEDVEFKYYTDVTSDIWEVKVYVSNADAAELGVASGESDTIANVNHFNNCLYLHLRLPYPAMDHGFNIQWGSYFGNFMTTNAGATQRVGYIEISDATLYGGTDPFNAPFITGLA